MAAATGECSSVGGRVKPECVSLEGGVYTGPLSSIENTHFEIFSSG